MERGWGISAVTAAWTLGGVDAGAWALSDCASVGPPYEHTASHKASVHTENLPDIFTPPHVMLITSEGDGASPAVHVSLLRPRSRARLILAAGYTTALRLAASRNQRALSFGMRFCVLKSTYTIPNRVP